MRKLFVLLTMSLLVVTASAQKLSWPPKSYPVKVPFTVSEEVKYYWDVQGVLCTGRGNGGYKFRILGTANHDFTASRSINFYYISSLGIPKNMEEAARVAVNGTPFPCDVGVLRRK